MKELGFRPIHKGKLRFSVDVEADSGIQMFNLMGFEDSGKRWISPPGAPVVIDGRHVASEATGKKAYQQIIGFRDAKTRERFGNAVIELVLARHPDAFGGPS